MAHRFHALDIAPDAIFKSSPLASHALCEAQTAADNWRMDKTLMKGSLGRVLRGLRQARSKRQAEVADPADYDAGNLSRVERGQQNIAPEVLAKVCQQLGVSVSEVYGLAERLSAGEQIDYVGYLRRRDIDASMSPALASLEQFEASRLPIAESQPLNYMRLLDGGHQDAEIINVPVMNAEGSMGPGRLAPEHDMIVDHMRLSVQWLRRSNLSFSSPGNLRIVIGYGDSMESTINDGDPVLVDVGITELKLDAIYVLSRETAAGPELFIKRMQRLVEGGFAMISDNPRYRPQTIADPEAAGLDVRGRALLAWNGRKL